MARLIDAMQTVTKMSGRITPLIRMGANPTQVYNEVLQVLAEAPTVDAVPVVHGAWVNVAGGRTICNHCGEYPLYDYFGRLKLSNSCPNCGAKMDLEVNDA